MLTEKEIFFSDVVYLGGRIISVSDFRIEYPEWYEKWKWSNKDYPLYKYLLIPDYSYGASAILNAVYSINFEKAIVDKMCSFECGKNEREMYYPPIRYGRKMMFIPNRARQWAYYDMDTCKWSYKSIPAEYLQGDGAFIKTWLPNKKRIICMLGCMKGMACIEFETGEISYYDCWNELKQNKEMPPKISSMIIYKDSVLLFTSIGNSVYEIDTNKMQLTKIYKIPFDCTGVVSAVNIPETDIIFLLEHTQANRIIKWNIHTGEIEEITELPILSKDTSVGRLFSGLYYDYTGLYLIPQQDKSIIKIDYQSNKLYCIEFQTELNLLERKEEFYGRWGDGLSYTVLAYNGYKNLPTVFLPYDFSIAEIDLKRGVFLNKRKWWVNGIEQLIKDQMKSLVDGVYYENSLFRLQEYVEDLLEK